MMEKVMSRQEQKVVINKFLLDKNRGISIPLFAELCGLHTDTLREVFIEMNQPLTEYVQRRVSKAYKAWQRGEVAIMQNRDRTKFVQYRKTPKPFMVRSMGLTVDNGQIKLKVGIKNKADYSTPDLDEQLRK